MSRIVLIILESMMTRLFKNPIILSTAMAFFMVGAASADTYTCSVKPRKSGNWVPEELVIFHDPSSGQVVVNDEYIMYYHKKPLAGEVSVDNPKRITFKWTIPTVRNATGQTTLRFNYRATFIKRTRKVTVTAQPAGFGDTFEGRGSCTVK